MAYRNARSELIRDVDLVVIQTQLREAYPALKSTVRN